MDIKTNYELFLKIGREYNTMVNNDKIEDDILIILKEYFDNTLIKHTYEFSKYDFESEKYLIELKTRNINMNDHDNTMIQRKKIIKTNKTIIFVFNYKDYLTYYIFNQKDIDNNICYYAPGYRRDRGFNEVNEMLYIPIKLLTIINKKTNIITKDNIKNKKINNNICLFNDY